MAKIYGLFGSMTGKTADVVMAVRNGVQIVRKYQPIVANPQSEAQVAARAKLKLMSQLSAVMAPVVAIPRSGIVSSRNLFVKKNYGATTFTNGQAEITLNSIQLTSSVVSLPNIGVVRGTNPEELTLRLSQTLTQIDRVVYSVFTKQADNTLRYIGSATALKDPASPTGDLFSTTFNAGTGSEVLVLAYGVRDNTETARATFGNMETVSAEAIAKLVTSRVLTEQDVTLTETKGFTLAAAA